MNKHDLNKYAISLAKKAFEELGYNIEEAVQPSSEVSFHAVSGSGKTMKIKIRAVSQIGSYVFVTKRKFNVGDPNLFMVLLYIPNDNDEKHVYLIPATDWCKNIYPFSGKDYNKPGQVSEPEWGISFSMKAKDALEEYRLSNMIYKME